MNEAKIKIIAFLSYTGLSLMVAIMFLLLTLTGDYTPIARYGGVVWVFILSMIIAMPVIIPLIKKKFQ